jgi:hypothetical protein
MYLRFVTARLDPQSGRRQGLFYAAYSLEANGTIVGPDLAELSSIHHWFSKNLYEPTRMAVSSRPHRKAQALSWFKATAVLHIAKMRRMQALLESYGTYSDVLRTRRPGYVVYEDRYQVVAFPFADTPQ